MITSTSNAQVKNLIRLKNKPKERRKQRLFITEGLRIFTETPEELTDCIYVSESFIADPKHSELLSGRKYEVFTDTVFDYIADTRSPQGILCTVKLMSYGLDDIIKGNDMLLILENIQDPGNLGTMIRTAEGAGISGVIMDDTTADIYSPKVIRSTMGSIFRVPFAVTDDLCRTLGYIKQKGISVYAAHLEGSVCYDEPDYTGASAFLIGNEGNGLSNEAAAAADKCIRIPMEGRLESLNAAVAAALIMYEGSRQRR